MYFPHYETLTFISCLSKYKPLTFPTFPRCSGTLNLMTLLHCFSTTKFTTASLDLRQKKKKQKVLKMAKCIPQPVYTAFVRCNKKTFYVWKGVLCSRIEQSLCFRFALASYYQTLGFRQLSEVSHHLPWHLKVWEWSSLKPRHRCAIWCGVKPHSYLKSSVCMPAIS